MHVLQIEKRDSERFKTIEQQDCDGWAREIDAYTFSIYAQRNRARETDISSHWG